MNKSDDQKIFQLWLGNELIEFTFDEIASDKNLERELKNLVKENQTNPLQFFCPHGEAKMGYDCGFQLVSMIDNINDKIHSFCMNCSPNQVGKTCHAVVKKALRLIKCNPKWKIFGNGVECPEWSGPKTLVVMGYDKGHLKDVVWPEYQKWIPDDELGDYRSFMNGGRREPAWDRNPRVPLRCGSRIIMLTYEQPASVCAGVKAEEIHADEQPPLVFFNELDERGRTRGGVRWDLSFTPHKVDGRSDTGVSGWLFDMWTGRNTRGHDVLRSRISVDEVPDHIYSKEQKKNAHKKWVEIPEQTGDENAIREGKARFYGLFQRASGLYYPEIDPNLHFVDYGLEEIRRDKRPCTFYRSIDYGYTNATSCGLWAVFSDGTILRFDEYYVTGKDATANAVGILEYCGNTRKKVRQAHDKETNSNYDVWEEEAININFVRTWLDWHCWDTTNGVGHPTAWYFSTNGLKVLPSTKFHQEQRAQNLRPLLRIDPNLKHMITGKMGAPRLYINRKKCHKWMWEWERCVCDTRMGGGDESHNLREGKRNKNDHAIDDTEYFACAGARYLGDYEKKEDVDEDDGPSSPYNKTTGY